jgi:hypothetical protein
MRLPHSFALFAKGWEATLLGAPRLPLLAKRGICLGATAVARIAPTYFNRMPPYAGPWLVRLRVRRDRCRFEFAR